MSINKYRKTGQPSDLELLIAKIDSLDISARDKESIKRRFNAILTRSKERNGAKWVTRALLAAKFITADLNSKQREDYFKKRLDIYRAIYINNKFPKQMSIN